MLAAKIVEPMPTPVTKDAFRNAMSVLASAVNVVTTDGPAGRAGFTATAVRSVSDEPPSLLVCLNRSASVYDIFQANDHLCVNTLTCDQQALSNLFGGKTAMDERFAVWSQRCLELYRQGSALLSCPFALPMPWDLPGRSLGLGCAKPRMETDQLRERLDWRTPRDRSALLCFGGLGLACRPAWLESWRDWRFLVLDPALATAGNAVLVPEELRPLDVMGLCERVITKPGFSTFCEALHQQCGLVVVRREGFAEAAVLESSLRRHGHHRFLSRKQFDCGDWELDQPLLPPEGMPLAGGGVDQAADFLLHQLQQCP